MKTKRNDRGATLALVAACAVLIIIIAVGLFLLARVLGGSRQLQDSVNSGNLNVAKNALMSPQLNNTTIATLSNGDGAEFEGVGESSAINLNNINRVYAQALLVQANAYAMQQEGTAGPNTISNSQKVADAAEALSEELATRLKNPNNIASMFASVANQNSLRMMPGNDGGAMRSGHEVSYTDRGYAANVKFNDNQIPPNLQTKWSTLKNSKALSVTANGQNLGFYPLGYVGGVNFNGTRDICFVPMKEASGAGNSVTVDQFQESQPHHISQSYFFRDSQPAPAWRKVAPNAFWQQAQAAEKVSNKDAILRACAVSKSMLPAQGYSAAIPYGFIKIVTMSCMGPAPTLLIPGMSGAAGQDIYTYLNANPVVKAEGPADGYFIMASDPDSQAALQRIIDGNKNGDTPCGADLAKLMGPNQTHPSADVGKTITGMLGPINNFNTELGPLSAIISALGIRANNVTAAAPCSAPVELANFDLLSQRAKAGFGSSDTANINIIGYFSGVTNIPPSRGPLPAPSGTATPANWQFTSPATMAQVLTQGGSATAVTERIKQRCYQIYPGFNGDLNSITGWSSTGVPIGGTAYIYLEATGGVNPETGVPNGSLVIKKEQDIPGWLQQRKSASPDGRPAAYDILGLPIPVKVGHPSGRGGPPGIINVNQDWGFPHPWDGDNFSPACNRNTFVATPGSGYRGALLELQMGACFGTQSCGESHVDASSGPISVPSFGECTGKVGTFTGPC